MSKWFYSPKVNGFFAEEIHKNIPEDVIELTIEDYKYTIDQINSKGKKIVIVDGRITFEDNIIPVTIEQVRSKRNKLLRESDYTQMPDWPGDKEAWARYRQALRDVPQNIKSLENVEWPEKPE